jgi:hypothetical protein
VEDARASLIALAVAACGPAIAPATNEAEPPTLGPGDEVADIGELAITGQAFAPQVLDSYGVAGVTSSRALPLDGERAKLAKTTDPKERQAEATVLATMLFGEASAQPDRRDALLGEAQRALAAAVAAAGAAPDPLALELLARFSLFVHDLDSADRAWQVLVARVPDGKEADVLRAWWVYTRLAQRRTAEAAALLAGAAVDRTPELGYVAAWTRWRGGDEAGAWTAIKRAVAQWSDPAAVRDNPERLRIAAVEALRFAARSGAPLDDAVSIMTALTGTQPADVYQMWKQLADAMRFAGRWADAVAAEDRALAVGTTPAADAVAIPLEQARLETRLDAPDAVARYATSAIRACGDACAQDSYDEVCTLAESLHAIYSSANDDRYYQPAHDLYAVCADRVADHARHDELAANSSHIELSHLALKPHTGRLGRSNVKMLVSNRVQELQACYEAALVAAPELAGAFALTLEIEQSGRVVAATPDGAGELAGVARCVAAAAKAWHFPARGAVGSTRATVRCTFQPAR